MESCRLKAPSLLGGSRVVRSRILSARSRVRSTIAILITLHFASHEPPSANIP